eukprot:3778070-Amphidinium_carterae.1
MRIRSSFKTRTCYVNGLKGQGCNCMTHPVTDSCKHRIFDNGSLESLLSMLAAAVSEFEA